MDRKPGLPVSSPKSVIWAMAIQFGLDLEMSASEIEAKG
jgi:hypothetical protein